MLLLDGIPIKNTYDDQFDPTLIPVDYIQEIKISTGGTSQLYGQGGIGGVINIITKKGTPGFHGSLTGEVSEENAYLGRATVYGASGKFNSFGSLSFYDRAALVPGLNDIVDTRGWLRPRLWGDRPVLPVRNTGHGHWQSIAGKRKE